MNIGIRIGNIFNAPKDLRLDTEELYYVHCISADYKLGAGIAKQMDKRFGIRNEIIHDIIARYPNDDISEIRFIYPGMYLSTNTGNVINLITKDNYYDKPTYEDFQVALDKMAEFLRWHRMPVTLVMPAIGCGLDKLSWPRVYMKVMKTFRDIPGDCWFYLLPPKD